MFSQETNKSYNKTISIGLLVSIVIFFLGKEIIDLQEKIEVSIPVEVYMVDPSIQRNLSTVRPYIELCSQNNGAWVWNIQADGKFIGECIPPIEVEGNLNTEEDIEENDKRTSTKTRPDKSLKI